MKLLLSLLTFSTLGLAQEAPPTRKVEKRVETIIERTETRDVAVTRERDQMVYFIFFDHSVSMGPVLEKNKKTVYDLLAANWKNPKFRVGAMVFSGCYGTKEDIAGADALLKADRTRTIPPGPGNQEIVWNAIKDRTAQGNTDLHRAFRVAAAELKENQYAQVILLTDRQDTCSGGDLIDLVAKLQQRTYETTEKKKFRVQDRKMTVHVISEATGEARSTLKKLAESTGGRYVEREEQRDTFIKDLGELRVPVTTEVRSVTQDEQKQEMRTEEKKEVGKAVPEKKPEAAEQKQTAKEKKKGTN